MSDHPTHDEDVRLVAKLRADAETCAGHDQCQVPLMYCAFGPADRCDDYAALWLRRLTRYDALMEEHEAGSGYRMNGHVKSFRKRWHAAHDKVEGLR